MIPGDILSAFPHRQFHTLPGLLDSWAALPNSYPNTCVPCREAVCTIFMMVFGMTRLGGELTTYRARSEHATDWASPTRFWFCGFFQLPTTGLTLHDFCRAMHQIRYDIEATDYRRGLCHLTEIRTLKIHPSHTTWFMSLDCVFQRYDGISQKVLNMFKT